MEQKEFDIEEIRKAREEELNQLSEKLEKGVEAFLSSDRYREYLGYMQKFHNYSFSNIILIAMQRPDATLVAGYDSWKRKGRHVKKGEKGIRIIAPVEITVKEKAEAEENLEGAQEKKEQEAEGRRRPGEKITVFRPTSVFDVSQTEGQPIPTIGVEEVAGQVGGYESMIEAVRRTSPVPICFGQIPGSAKGYYSNEEKLIMIRQGMPQAQSLKTMIHELAHAKLHDRDAMQARGEEIDRMTKEIEAESTAFIVCSHFHIDTSEYSFPYVGMWSKGSDMKQLRDSMEKIRKTSFEMIEGLSQNLREVVVERSGVKEEQAVQPDAYTPFTLSRADSRQVSGAEPARKDMRKKEKEREAR